MKEAFEKIKERLEEEKKAYSELVAIHFAQRNNRLAYVYKEKELAIKDAIEIVNQVAEEYNQSLANNNQSLTNDSWIPCSERLPECDDYAETNAILFQLQSGSIEVGYFGKKNAWRDAYFRHYRTPCGFDASDVIAWKPLPEPYQPKGE